MDLNYTFTSDTQLIANYVQPITGSPIQKGNRISIPVGKIVRCKNNARNIEVTCSFEPDNGLYSASGTYTFTGSYVEFSIDSKYNILLNGNIWFNAFRFSYPRGKTYYIDIS